jgi:hypothetical protein
MPSGATRRYVKCCTRGYKGFVTSPTALTPPGRGLHPVRNVLYKVIRVGVHITVVTGYIPRYAQV